MLQCSEQTETIYPKNAVSFSQDFFLAVRSNEPYEKYLDTLNNIDLGQLENELSTQNKKLAFWINMYNALVQVKIQMDRNAYEDREKFFNTSHFTIGNQKLSLNTIEKGILRRQEVHQSKSFVRTFQVDTLDPRIHFTLNCGATSCPPIAFYSPEDIEDQMVLAEQNFIEQSSKFDPTSNKLTISEIFKWFEDDFGGKVGIIARMQKHRIVPPLVEPEISYTPYDWSLDTNNQ